MITKKIQQIYAQALWDSEVQARREAFDRSYRSCAATAHLHPDFRHACRKCLGKVCSKMVARGLDDEGEPLPFADRPVCGALTRIGAICANRVTPGKAKCRLHGGKSTGPKTEAGKARVAEAQRQRWARYRAQKTDG